MLVGTITVNHTFLLWGFSFTKFVVLLFLSNETTELLFQIFYLNRAGS